MSVYNIPVYLILFLLTIITGCSNNTHPTQPDFPVQKKHDYDYPAGLTRGKLVLEDNCLQLVTSYESYLLIWPHGHSLRIIEDNIQVINPDGKDVSQVGDIIMVGGGEVTAEIANKYSERGVPEHYQGSYWLISEFMSTQRE